MTKKIVLAGGCFWGIEDLIRKLQRKTDCGNLRIYLKKPLTMLQFDRKRS